VAYAKRSTGNNHVMAGFAQGRGAWLAVANCGYACAFTMAVTRVALI
jgi:hypothetical protein